jgi:hypothetical protein
VVERFVVRQFVQQQLEAASPDHPLPKRFVGQAERQGAAQRPGGGEGFEKSHLDRDRPRLAVAALDHGLGEPLREIHAGKYRLPSEPRGHLGRLRNVRAVRRKIKGGDLGPVEPGFHRRLGPAPHCFLGHRRRRGDLLL